jgi:hypothetical protein
MQHDFRKKRTLLIVQVRVILKANGSHGIRQILTILGILAFGHIQNSVFVELRCHLIPSTSEEYQ